MREDEVFLHIGVGQGNAERNQMRAMLGKPEGCEVIARLVLVDRVKLRVAKPNYVPRAGTFASGGCMCADVCFNKRSNVSGTCSGNALLIPTLVRQLVSSAER